MRLHLLSACIALAVLALPALLLADEQEELLRQANIKFTRNAAGNIVTVELPSGARDFHIEALLDIPTITEVKAPRCGAAFKAIESLKQLPSLTVLNLDGVKEANDYVACLRGLTSLKSLSMANSELTNSGLHDICLLLTGLQELNISRTQVTPGSAFSSLVRLRELQTLDITGIRVRSVGARNADRGDFSQLAGLPNLKRLRARHVPIAAEHLYSFGSNCNLEEFTIAARDVRGAGPMDANQAAAALVYLQECNPSLRLGPVIFERLGVHRTTFDGNGHLVGISNCPYPVFMQLPRSQLTRLNDLWIIGAGDLQFVEWLPDLKTLTLEFLPKDRQSLAKLHSLRQLTVLKVTRATIDSDAATELLAIPSLKQLVVESCNIDSRAETIFQDQKGEKQVDIRM